MSTSTMLEVRSPMPFSTSSVCVVVLLFADRSHNTQEGLTARPWAHGFCTKCCTLAAPSRVFWRVTTHIATMRWFHKCWCGFRRSEFVTRSPTLKGSINSPMRYKASSTAATKGSWLWTFERNTELEMYSCPKRDLTSISTNIHQVFHTKCVHPGSQACAHALIGVMKDGAKKKHCAARSSKCITGRPQSLEGSNIKVVHNARSIATVQV
mmetsp:Transcript_14252/g.36455  ORF Transcript_14252/g.36455 Transcript_14252/m.36455 type:complete len:210 (+) Transcript_14252:791-1420(+)